MDERVDWTEVDLTALTAIENQMDALIDDALRKIGRADLLPEAGEPQPTEEVAAPVLPRAVDGATPGDASGEGNEPDTGAAADDGAAADA